MSNEEHDQYLSQSEGELLEPFDVRAQASRRGMYILIGGFLFLLLLAAITMNLFSGGTRGRDQTPRILADNDPYKQAPIKNMETETPQDQLEIYDVQNGTVVEKPVTIAPLPEEPLVVPESTPETQTGTQTPPKANVVIKEPVVDTQPIAQPIPAPVQSTANNGNYVVQIASLRTNSEANELWGKINNKLGDVILPSHFADIKRVNLGAKGIYYRLRISGLADKAAANNLCSRLKARKQDCLVTRK